jgi:hypothetical protein
LISSRHNGPAFVAVSTSSMVKKTVPISAATVSGPGFSLRFTDINSEIDRRNRPPSISDSEWGHRNGRRFVVVRPYIASISLSRERRAGTLVL